MSERLDVLLRDASLVTVALGLAIGWSLYQTALGIADLVEGLLTTYKGIQYLAITGDALTWRVGGDRLLTLDQLMKGLVELASLLLLASIIARRPATRL